MTIHQRIKRLERDRQPAPLSVEDLAAESAAIDHWLAERGLTLQEAAARGERGPAGWPVGWLAQLAEGEREFQEDGA